MTSLSCPGKLKGKSDIMGVDDVLKKMWWLFENIEVIAGGASTVLMIVLMFVQVVSRYMFNYAIPWTEELAVVCFILSIYLGCSLAVTREKHLTIDMFLHFMPFKVKKILLIISNIFFMSFCLYIIDPLSEITYGLYKGGTKLVVTGIPQYLIYATVEFCLVLTAIRLLQKSIELYHQKEEAKGKTAILDLDNL